jgi:hypothetical protein
MTIPAWPESLPVHPLTQGFEETLPNTMLRTQMDAGPAKQRRRVSAMPRPTTVSFTMSTAQVATFDAFYIDDLEGGALRYSYAGPRTGTTYEFRFTEPPKYSHLGGDHYTVACKIEQMP